MPSSWKTSRIFRLSSSQRVDLRSADGEALPELGAAIGGKQLEQIERPAEHPDRHHVRVRVVVEAGCRCGRVGVVVLVGTHHAADLVAVERAVVAGDRAQKRAISRIISAPEIAQEPEVAGDLVVLPDVVGDRGVDVPLERELSGLQRPERGFRCRRWVSSRPSLPLCHGNIAPVVAGLLRRPTAPRRSRR